jgi:hypothetical protein
LSERLPSLPKIEEISKTPMPGVFEIRVQGNEIFYTDASAKFVVIKSAGECTVDSDNDGIPNRLDLDSDNDGCSDAYEAGATTATTANYVFAGPYGNNGLANSKETIADNGIINYSSTYSDYGLDKNINADQSNNIKEKIVNLGNEILSSTIKKLDQYIVN